MTIETQLDDARLANATLREKWRLTIVERDELLVENKQLQEKCGRLQQLWDEAKAKLEAAREWYDAVLMEEATWPRSENGQVTPICDPIPAEWLEFRAIIDVRKDRDK